MHVQTAARSLAMSILRYFRKTLLSASETEIGEVATREMNKRVQEVLDRVEGSSSRRRKQKPYTVYSDEDRARIGRYAAENSNASALRKFKGDFPDLSESIIPGFETKYLTATKKLETGEVVTSIESKKRG